MNLLSLAAKSAHIPEHALLSSMLNNQTIERQREHIGRLEQRTEELAAQRDEAVRELAETKLALAELARRHAGCTALIAAAADQS